MHAAVLQRANHLEPGAIADVTETFEGMASKGALQNLAITRSIKKRSPLFEFTHALRRLQGMNLGHAPVVQKLATAHRVAKMGAPVVSRVDIGHRRGDSAFGHHRVRFAEE